MHKFTLSITASVIGVSAITITNTVQLWTVNATDDPAIGIVTIPASASGTSLSATDSLVGVASYPERDFTLDQAINRTTSPRSGGQIDLG